MILCGKCGMRSELADDGASNPHVKAVKDYAVQQNSEVFVICAGIEEEISELDDDERKMFLEDLGLTESGLEKLVRASYRLLGLMSFLTSGEDETRAWTIKIGTKAPQAAGKIHTDFERGFIKAEVVNYQDLLDCGSYAGAREKRPGSYGRKGICGSGRRCDPVPFQCISRCVYEYISTIPKSGY